MRDNDTTRPDATPQDADSDRALRPSVFTEFVGQESIVDNLKIFISAARKREEPLDHVLLTGPPGLGKTTLSYIISHELNTRIRVTSGPALEKPGDLAGILTSLEAYDVLFIDEIHRLPAKIEEYLYAAMEDFRVDIIIESGPGARTIQLGLQPFTLVGATTRAGLLSAPLRSRFGISNRLDYYGTEQIGKILRRSAGLLQVRYDEEAIEEIARRSRGTPRIANRLLRRCRDFAQADPALAHAKGILNIEVAKKALLALDVDQYGLDEMDKRILSALVEKYKGGPVGISTLAVAVGEESGTLEEVYEPFLIQTGFIHRTPRGREATDLTYKHLGLQRPTRTGQEHLNI